jgi:hypothetical protein
MNFQPDEQHLAVDLSGLSAHKLINIQSGDEQPRYDRFELTLPAYGFGLWALTP